ncbi:MAG: hemerythrin domain-containing protein, partial [Sideroxyarcus sp.]|nr:hemerythrin domain-containing protein [Sideroxyarcus sp.]
MNKEEGMLAISRLVFELTITSTTTSDLDILLERLFAILENYYDLQLEPRGAILLLNPRGHYFQVAQFGMEPAWTSPMQWNSAAFTNPVVIDRCQTQDTLTCAEMPVPARMLLLPLHTEGVVLGYTVLFAPLTYELSPVHSEFMNNLARALSSLVNRALTHETLRIREVELEESRADVIRSLGVASEYRDSETGLHIMRMTNIAQAIAKALGLPEAQRELLYVAAPMHDVGKIGIADAVLLKPGKLTPEEFEIMKAHTAIGVTILAGKDELIVAARDIAGSHHERWDGNGYPNGLKEEQIPLLARICAVADVFDALTSARPYKQAWPVEEAFNWVMAESGRHFDPAVVRAFEMAMPDILRIRELYRDDIIDPKQVLSLPPIRRRQNVWIPWTEDLSIGIDVIDEHHRYLFDLINDLYEVVAHKRGAREVARLIKALDAYAKVHFRAEEQMMNHYGYKGIYRQLDQHHAFEEKIAEFYEELH